MFSMLQFQKFKLMLSIVSINIEFSLSFDCNAYSNSIICIYKMEVFYKYKFCKPVFCYGFPQLHISSLHLNFKVYFQSLQLHNSIFKERNIRIKIICNSLLLCTIAQLTYSVYIVTFSLFSCLYILQTKSSIYIVAFKQLN